MAAPAVIPKMLVVNELSASPGIVEYVTPSTDIVTRVGLILVHNIDGSPHTFSIRSSLGPMVVDDEHCLYKDVAIAAGATKVYPVPRVLGGGGGLGRLHFEADAASVLWCYVTGSELDTLHADVGRAIPSQPLQFLLTTSPQTLMGAVGSLSQVLMSLTLCNVDSSPHVVTINYSFFPVPVYVVTVPANDTLEITSLLIADDVALGDGGLTITGDSGSVVAATISVVDVDIS